MKARHLALAAPLALIMAFPSLADARRPMEIALQDDITILNTQYNRDLALLQFAGMGGTHVRITIDHSREPADRNDTSLGATRVPTPFIDRAINRVLEFGLTPQVTLYWKDQDDKFKLADWMFNVVDHFGPRVNRYSVLNEPDLYMPEQRPCNRRTKAGMVEQFPHLMVEEDGKIRAKTRTRAKTVNLTRACQRYQRGVAYRRVFRPAARAIRDGNPRAQILAGETSPTPALDWFFRGSRAHKLNADAWAHHPFQFQNLNPAKATTHWGLGNLKLVKRSVRMPLYLTEFGYPHPNSTMDRRYYKGGLADDDLVRALPRAWSVARRSGARQMTQFQWWQKTVPFSKADFWDTALNNFDNQPVSPQYFALRERILSWR